MLNKQPKNVNVRLRDRWVLVFWQSSLNLFLFKHQKKQFLHAQRINCYFKILIIVPCFNKWNIVLWLSLAPFEQLTLKITCNFVWIKLCKFFISHLRTFELLISFRSCGRKCARLCQTMQHYIYPFLCTPHIQTVEIYAHPISEYNHGYNVMKMY